MTRNRWTHCLQSRWFFPLPHQVLCFPDCTEKMRGKVGSYWKATKTNSTVVNLALFPNSTPAPHTPAVSPRHVFQSLAAFVAATWVPLSQLWSMRHKKDVGSFLGKGLAFRQEREALIQVFCYIVSDSTILLGKLVIHPGLSEILITTKLFSSNTKEGFSKSERLKINLSYA